MMISLHSHRSYHTHLLSGLPANFVQYAVEFADSYVLEADASLLSNGDGGSLFSDTVPAISDVSDLSSKLNTEGHETAAEAESYPSGIYERLLQIGRAHV